MLETADMTQAGGLSALPAASLHDLRGHLAVSFTTLPSATSEMVSDQELSVVEARPVTPDQAISRSGSPDFVSSIPPQTRQDTAHLTPYSRPPEYNHGENSIYSTQHDPSRSAEDLRVSSSHSLLPDEGAIDGRRKLLLIYIHGFMGAEISFQSFPAHVHRILTDSLSETHVVHSKIYPRYKSRGTMNVARDAFSYWLSPHESENTDVILLGHSLGGILATEVALLRSSWSGSTEIFQHRILGVINFDVPFLGMHPGVVSAGLGSLFRPKAKSPEPPSGNSSTPEAITDSLAASSLSSPSSSSIPTDSNFDAPFPNDVRLKERGQLDGALHFIMKHSDRLARATKEYVTSHLEFGGCLADYPGLKDRYRWIRALEDVDEYARQKDPHGRPLRRIRFVNYYTASTGYIKPVSAANNKRNSTTNTSAAMNTTSEERITTSSSTSRQTMSQSSSTISSIELRSSSQPADLPPDYETSQAYHQLSIDSGILQETSEQQTPTSSEEAKAGNKPGAAADTLSPQTTTSSAPVSESFSSLPPLPLLPGEPAAFDPSKYTDKDTLKLAQKEHSRQMKAYERARKDREKAVKDREKLIKKREKAAAKEAKEAAKDSSSQRQVTQKTESITIEETAVQTPPPLPPRESSTSITTTSAASSSKHQDPDNKADGRNKSAPALPPRQGEAHKPKKDRKFCSLPSKGPDGTRDPLWVRVYMEGIDEVAAHQSLFIPNNDYYEKLVGDTAARIQEWVQEAQTTRMVLGEIEALD
ncbi:conserved hypothetical protein [Paecilomyces variotii No. 5]|uniref:DUF676 domain-containing protein n=1 Tax=Byssochlamys spectabilis (strain No. 5 / NBRC 109023) TaxID=1356009 RepID=V5FNZ4_BYSSN|nr:conserved hypothetical protein [Paecilomyces variotii No. 5]